MALFTEDSDEDSIATNTTAESEHSDDEGFNVEQILAEDVSPEDVKLYLVKWEGYPLDRCTWEPSDQFGSELPVNVWRARKRAAAQGGEPLFDAEEFYEAVELAQSEKEKRAKRRDAKRRKRSEILSRSQSPVKPASLKPAATRKVTATSPVKKKGIAQKVVKLPQPTQPPTKAKTAGPAPATKSMGKAAVPAEPIAASLGPARKTAPSGSSLIGANAPPLKRKQRPRVSGDTPKDSTAPKFKNLATQNRFRSHSRTEPAPDINALVMIDPKTGKPLTNQTIPAPATKPTNDNGPVSVSPYKPEAATTQPSVTKDTLQAGASKPAGPAAPKASYTPNADQTRSVVQPEPFRRTVPQHPKPKVTIAPLVTLNQTPEIHSAYGRRTPPAERRRLFPSPVSPEPMAQSEVPTTALPLSHPRRTICKNWQAGHCPWTSATCRFAHSYVNTVSKLKRVTCYYWYNGNSCNKTAEGCDFAHEDTGEYAGPPGSYRWKPQTSGSGALPSANDTPVNYERRQQVADTAAVEAQAQVPVTPSADAMDITTYESAIPVTASPPTVDNSPLDMEHGREDGAVSAHRIQDDLALAKKSIGNLDASTLLSKGRNVQIENVYILMPPEREGERQLLVDFFKGFHCKVFHSGLPQHWSFFRKTFSDAVIVIHPDECFLGTIPKFARYLLQYKASVFSIGVHEDWSGLGQPNRTYEARRVFPMGGMTFIADDIFVYYPEKALEIIEAFRTKARTRPPGAETSKIGARPGIRDWLMKLAIQKMEEGDGEDYADDRYIKCWDAVCDLCPLEDYDPWQMELGQMVPKDDALLWSVEEEDLPSFKGLWEENEAKATDFMANLFAGTMVERMSEFRRCCFIYQRPNQEKLNDEVPASQLPAQAIIDQVDPKGWMSRYNHIEVMTPDACLHMTRKMQ